ncbi:hypothetical protein DY000_02039826 [Brassica cretica]|uniref:Uncharacterized protein n=1 Tax=Brassica cretica TaxID=69181 RepID=A0ABQ7BKH1_BRACR|nr:hypothetical protein DY000_02039826 [Brassica cretica]
MGGKGGKVLYTLSTVGLEDVSGFGAVGAAYRPTSSHVCRSTFSSSPDSPSCSLRSGFIIYAGKTRFTKLGVLIMEVHFIYGLCSSFEIRRVIVFYFEYSGSVLIR